MNILWIPHTGWHIPQRAHMFCHALSHEHRVHVTDWVADFSRPQDYCSRRYVRNFSYRQHQDRRVLVHGLPRIAPALPFAMLRHFNRHLVRGWVARLIARYAIDVVVGTFVAPVPQASRIVFDLFDENVAAWQAQHPAYAAEIAATEHSYMTQADAVVAVSPLLVAKARQLGSRGAIHLIPNGVDLARFGSAEREVVRRDWNVDGLVIGSVGNHDDPGQCRKILEVARLLPTATFVLVGRGQALPEMQRQAKVAKITNLRFVGAVPPRQIPAILAALDVGLCPYAQTPLDQARSPMRLLEYAAAGLPVVCTALPAVEHLGFENVVLIEDTPQALAQGIQQAQSLPRRVPPNVQHFDLARLVARYAAVLSGKEVAPWSLG